MYEHFGENLSTTCTVRQLGDNNFFFFPVVAQEVESVINNLNNKKSSGQDMISVKVMKCLAPYVSGHLAHLINFSVTLERFCHT